jgi:hypothetical protein
MHDFAGNEIIVYLDESASHHKKVTDQVIVVAGYVARLRTWQEFIKGWQSVLKKYKTNYFHFSEWSAASAICRGKRAPFDQFKNNPYRNWSLENLDGFLYELADVAGANDKLPIAGAINLSGFERAIKINQTAQSPLPYDNNIYKYCLNEVFKSFFTETNIQWPDFADKVFFVFDQTHDPKWQKAINEVFSYYRNNDSRIFNFYYADKKVDGNEPLQAADMIAFRARQLVEHFIDGKLKNQKSLDHAIFRNLEASIRKLYPNLERR